MPPVAPHPATPAGTIASPVIIGDTDAPAIFGKKSASSMEPTIVQKAIPRASGADVQNTTSQANARRTSKNLQTPRVPVTQHRQRDLSTASRGRERGEPHVSGKVHSKPLKTEEPAQDDGFQIATRRRAPQGHQGRGMPTNVRSGKRSAAGKGALGSQ